MDEKKSKLANIKPKETKVRVQFLLIKFPTNKSEKTDLYFWNF